MKKKIIYFLFILCSFLFVNYKVYAEGEELTEQETNKVNYKELCKQYSDDNERINCCNQASEDSDKNDCKKPIYQKCDNYESILEGYECCNTIEDKNDKNACTIFIENTCNTSQNVYLSKAASNVKIVYEPFEYKPDGFDDETSEHYSEIYYWMDIKIYNVTSELYIQVDNGEKTFIVDSSNMNKDGVIVIRNSDTTVVRNFTFTIYSGIRECQNKSLRTIRLTLPKYNLYSTRNACVDIPQYYLCHQFINFDVDASNFLTNVENYKAKLNNKTKVASDDANNSTSTKKALMTISNNKYLFIGGILLIGCIITVLIMRRRND